jgi:peptidoglycan/LPS O-acetylase OafA/YrhL
MIAYFKFDPALGVRSAFTNLATSIFVGLIIVNCIRQQNNLLFRFLNLKIMNLIGILSYSIYIWQQLFLSNDPKFAPSKAPLNFIWIIAVSAISYFCYEKYFLKLKNRFIKIKSRSNVQV